MNNALRTIAQWQIVASAKRSENPSPVLGEGEPRKWWVRDWIK